MGYIVNTSKFNPLSFEEMLRPLAPSITQQATAKATLQKDLEDAMTIERIVNSLDLNEEGNQQIVDDYNDYIQGIRTMADDLSTMGKYNSKGMQDLRNKYIQDILNIKTTDAQIRKMQETLSADLKSDSSLIWSTMNQEPTFAQMYKKPYTDLYKKVSGNQLTAESTNRFKGISEQQIEPEGTDNGFIKYSSKMNDEDLYNQVALIDYVFKSNNPQEDYKYALSLGMDSNLFNTVQDLYKNSGVADWDNNFARDKALSRIYEGMFSAIGKTYYQVDSRKNNEGNTNDTDGRLNSNFYVKPWTGNIANIKDEVTTMNNLFNNLDKDGNVVIDGEIIDINNLMKEYPTIVEKIKDHPLVNNLNTVLSQLKNNQNPALAKWNASAEEVASISYYKERLRDYANNHDVKDWNLQDILDQYPNLLNAMYKSWGINDPQAVEKAKIYTEQISKLKSKNIDILSLPEEVQSKLVQEGVINTYSYNPNYHSYTDNVWIPMFNGQGDSMFKNAINWLNNQPENNVIWKTEDGVNVTAKGGTTYTMKDIMDRLNEENVIDISYNPLTDYYGQYMEQQGVTDDVLILTLKSDNGKKLERFFVPAAYFGTDIRTMAAQVSNAVQQSTDNYMYNHTPHINNILKAYAGQSRNTFKDFQNKDKNKPQ